MAQIEVAFADVDRTFGVHECYNPYCVHGNRMLFEMPEKLGVFTYPIQVTCEECGMAGPKAYGLGHLEHYEEAVSLWNTLALALDI